MEWRLTRPIQKWWRKPTVFLLMGVALGVTLRAGPVAAQTFSSGSTGADGAFNPTVSTTLPLPPDGVFNFTTVNIPAGVTVQFQRNATNTPVFLLATGDVSDRWHHRRERGGRTSRGDRHRSPDRCRR